MTLKARLIAYLAAVHAAVAAVLLAERAALGWWLFPLEVALVASFLLGLRWIGALAERAAVTRTFSSGERVSTIV